ncbi:GNAT family N-acetyltransferase [Streptomyces coelicoflavus]|uniref:GNAT family N-acetyltransferase n=1 Tax=Streptomyces coelicoflavus TaxID=285562 RepID=UPI00367DE5D3
MSNDALTGRTARLVPLSVDHAESLLPSASDPEVWRWMPRPRPESLAEIRSMLEQMIDDPARRCFTVQRLDDQSVVGSTSLYEVDLVQGRAEIGATWFDRSCWGGPYNTESKLLLFSHAFDTLGLTRVALRTDNLNERSQKALIHLGLVAVGSRQVARQSRVQGAARHRAMRPATVALNPRIPKQNARRWSSKPT